MTETKHRPQLSLRTFGAPDLMSGPDSLKLRAKDLALLVYLRLQPQGSHRRTVLAGLLWAENSERGARHSLTQAVGRLRKVLGPRAIVTGRDTVAWAGDLPCDAAMLEDAARLDTPSLLEFYGGEFVSGLALGVGAQGFESWAGGRRVDYRDLAADLADRWGAAAEGRGEWSAALRQGQRAVEIDPYLETGHRRILRALDALGERNRALQHYAQYAAQVHRELGLAPQAETTALADAIRARGAPAPPPSDPPSPPFPPPPPPRADVPPPPSTRPEPRACADPAAPDAGDGARMRWMAAGVIAVSVLMAFLLARTGVRAS